MKWESDIVRDASHADEAALNCRAGVAPFVHLAGGKFLAKKVEKKRVSRRTWYWAFIQRLKLQRAALQDLATQMGRDWSGKFLQFLENFSGVYPRGGADASAVRRAHRRGGVPTLEIHFEPGMFFLNARSESHKYQQTGF